MLDTVLQSNGTVSKHQIRLQSATDGPLFVASFTGMLEDQRSGSLCAKITIGFFRIASAAGDQVQRGLGGMNGDTAAFLHFLHPPDAFLCETLMEYTI